MFQAIEPIYNRIYEIIRDEFVTKNSTLKTFEHGFLARQERSVDKALYPWAFLEWGTVGVVYDVARPSNFIRAPYTEGYELSIPLVILTFADQGERDRLIFNPSPGSGHNLNPGIGDLVVDIGHHIRSQYRSSFWATPPSPVWNIATWTFAGVHSPRLSHLNSFLLFNDTIRASQIDFNIVVLERG